MYETYNKLWKELQKVDFLMHVESKKFWYDLRLKLHNFEQDFVKNNHRNIIDV